MGRGLKQLTGRKNYEKFADYVAANGSKVGQSNADAQNLANQIKANSDLIASDIYLAARSAAHFWDINVAKYPATGQPTGLNLHKTADKLGWSSPIPGASEADFGSISRGIATKTDSFITRWEAYKFIAPKSLTGGNPHENMQAVINRLGFSTTSAAGHESKFGLSLAQRQAKAIGSQTQNLLASHTAPLTSTLSPSFDSDEIINSDLFKIGIQDRETIMWQIEPPVIPQEVFDQPILISQVDNGSMHTISKHSKARAIGRCQTAFANVEGLESTKIIHPAWDAENYFSHFEGRKSDKNIFSEKAKLKLIQQPRNGRLNKDLTEYYPNSNFIGKDIFIIEVQENGINVNIYYNMLVSDSPDNVTYGLFGKHCGPTGIWKISQSPADLGNIDPATWLQTAQLSSLLASANESLTGFKNLAGSAVGNTVGEGLGAQITLDLDAAGHGWYIDATPLDNTDDYLPTSDANIWQAKPGSAAEGKMDMLSVLLHEYGHALGLDHTADSHNFMAETLQPGQRKLPSAQELQLMAALVAELKGEMSAADPVAANNGTDPLSGSGSDPTAPASLALMGLLALRRKQEDAAAEASTSALTMQKLLSVNPTLQNTGFTQGTAGSATQGWTVDGTVITGSNSITLKETTTAQTTLSQAFVLGANDKKLSFTVDGVALNGVGGQLSSAPADAFEVALLDATNYDNLLSPAGLGWTRSDAALNLQRDATGALLERKAAGVTSKVNLDGSTTYTLDLSGIPAGKAVLLSFDLLGFSGNNGGSNESNNATSASQITLRNIRLSIGDELPNTAPVASNVSNTLAEDTALTVNLLAQVVDAEGDALTFNVTNTGAGAPQHGTVQLLEGGLVRYRPEANYFGADSFTYTVSDGQNTASATVNLTVTAVNDAPTLSDLSLTLAEDGSTSFNPWLASPDINSGVALAQDVDSTVVGSPLTVSIVTGPVHGQVVVQMDGSILYIPNAKYFGPDTVTCWVNLLGRCWDHGLPSQLGCWPCFRASSI